MGNPRGRWRRKAQRPRRHLPTGPFNQPDLRLAAVLWFVCCFRFCHSAERICCAHQAQQSVPVTLSPVSLFTAPEQAWLHTAVSPDFICARDFSRTAKLFFFFPRRSDQRDLRQHAHACTYPQSCRHTRPYARAHTHTERRRGLPFSAGRGPSHPF